MHKYYLGLKELDDDVGGIKGGTNILLIGPPLSSKESVLNSVMSYGLGASEPVILVETRVPGANMLEGLSLPGGSAIGVVDCVTRKLGINARDTPHIKHATSHVDLTGVGVRVSQFMEEFGGQEAGRVRLCIDSISTMLMYSNLSTVFRFIHVITGQVVLRGNLGVYVADECMLDDQAISTLKQLFNAVLQVKVENDRTFVRAVGLTPRPTAWYEYQVVDRRAVIGGGEG